MLFKPGAKDGVFGVPERACKAGAAVAGHVGCHPTFDKGAKLRRETDKRRRIRLVAFCHNLLIPLDLSRLRQLVINLVSRLLTERLGAALREKACARLIHN